MWDRIYPAKKQKWNGVERRSRQRSISEQAYTRTRIKEDGMKIAREWIAVIVAAFALVAAIGGPYMAWGATTERIKNIENISNAAENKSKMNSELLAEHKAIIPTVQADIRELKESIKEQRMDIKEILRAVKS